MGQSNIKRGEKWYKISQENEDSRKWINSQKSICQDIEEYLDSIKDKSKPEPVSGISAKVK